MDPLQPYSIPVSGLRIGTYHYEFNIREGFWKNFPETPLQNSDVNVKLTFEKQQDMYDLLFEIEGTVRTACDRCLDQFSLPIELSERLLFKLDETPYEDADIIHISPNEKVLNVAVYIYELVILAVPIFKSHEDADLSCDPDMLRFLEARPADEAPSEPDSDKSPWAALKNFKENNN